MIGKCDIPIRSYWCPIFVAFSRRFIHEFLLELFWLFSAPLSYVYYMRFSKLSCVFLCWSAAGKVGLIARRHSSNFFFRLSNENLCLHVKNFVCWYENMTWGCHSVFCWMWHVGRVRCSLIKTNISVIFDKTPYWRSVEISCSEISKV